MDVFEEEENPAEDARLRAEAAKHLDFRWALARKLRAAQVEDASVWDSTHEELGS